MFLFIFESIGTSELIMIGIVALIFLGPRKLPEMARKIGKLMAEFRGTASEFKETWQREVDFEQEAKAFDLDALEAEAEPVARSGPGPAPSAVTAAAPTIKEIDPATLEHLRTAGSETTIEKEAVNDGRPDETVDENAGDKKNWL